MNIPYLSPSQISNFDKCPAKWMMTRYPDDFTDVSTKYHAIVGTAVHSTIEASINNTKYDPSEELDAIPESERCSFRNLYDTYINNWNTIKKRLSLDNISTEQKHRVNAGPTDLLGIFDAVDEKDNVIMVYDWKTGGRYPEHELQASIYRYIAERTYNKTAIVQFVYLKTNTIQQMGGMSNQSVELKVKDIYDKIQKYGNTEFPFIIGSHCGTPDRMFCGFMPICPKWKGRI